MTYISEITVLRRRFNQRTVNKLMQMRPLLGTVMNVDTLRMLMDEKLGVSSFKFTVRLKKDFSK